MFKQAIASWLSSKTFDFYRETLEITVIFCPESTDLKELQSSTFLEGVSSVFKQQNGFFLWSMGYTGLLSAGWEMYSNNEHGPS